MDDSDSALQQRWLDYSRRLESCLASEDAAEQSKAADWRHQLELVKKGWRDMLARRGAGQLTDGSSLDAADAVIQKLSRQFKIRTQTRRVEHQREEGKPFSLIWWIEMGFRGVPATFKRGQWRLFVDQVNDELKSLPHALSTEPKFGTWYTPEEFRELEAIADSQSFPDEDDADEGDVDEDGAYFLPDLTAREIELMEMRESASWAFNTWVWSGPFAEAKTRPADKGK